MSAELVTGRELDAQIATQVMGWHFDGRVWSDADGLNQEYVDGWSPSTSIEAAWQVAAHIASTREVQVRIDLLLDGRAEVSIFSMGVSLGYSLEDTAPLAICRAALEAVGKS